MIETIPLFRPLNECLIAMLANLPSSDWNKKTVAKMWTVKDVAAHLLDGNLRCISMYRDQHAINPGENISDYRDLVNYLNRLNADWVNAMKRVSPQLLTEWLSQSHEDYVACLEKLDPHAPAKFSVAWAGDEVSPNWFHIAREYTEKWHHQQQIRDAVAQPGILTRTYYKPVLDTFMRALPHLYKDIRSASGTVEIKIDSDAGGTWFLESKDKQWELREPMDHEASVSITIPAGISWKLFTKAVRFEEVKKEIVIRGDEKLAWPVLQMIAVMA